jgi:CubicO group peptidase (beta-lactamase class C family)
MGFEGIDPKGLDMSHLHFCLKRLHAIVPFLFGAILSFFPMAAVAQPWHYADAASVGWPVSASEAVKAYAGDVKPTALMVVQDGKVIFHHGDVLRKVNAASVRKSLLSALYGIAIAEGKINLDATLGELGIDDKPPALTATEKQATVRDLLMSRSGIYHKAAHETADIRKKRPQRGSHVPGSFWFYNNWDFNALGTIYRQKTGDDIFQSFNQRIALPIGMEDFSPSDGRYVLEKTSIHPAYPFRMSARDLARFGQLFLNGGQWGGKQIVPGAWVKEATTRYSSTDRGNMGYGYLWWTSDADGLGSGAARANGYGGQHIAIVPAKRLVIVQTVETPRKTKGRTRRFGQLVRQLAEVAP